MHTAAISRNIRTDRPPSGRPGAGRGDGPAPRMPASSAPRSRSARRFVAPFSLLGLLLVAAVGWEGVGGIGRTSGLEGSTPFGAVAGPVVADEIALPRFDVVRIARDGLGVLAGRAAPGARVRLHAGERVLAHADADTRGEWALIVRQPLAVGLNRLELSARVGEWEVRSPHTLLIMRPPPEDAEASSSPGILAVLMPESAGLSSRLLQKPGLSGPVASGARPVVDTVEFGGAERAVIAGRAPPRRMLTLTLDGGRTIRLTADNRGRWRLTLNRSLEPGMHRLRLGELDRDGFPLRHVVQHFETGPVVAPPPGGTGIAMEVDDRAWSMIRVSAGSEARYTLIFRENAGRVYEPGAILPG